MTTSGVLASHPLVVLGVPAYNEERYIRECLQSIQRQSHQEFVVLIGDNASTDGTSEICAEFAAADRRFVHVRLPINVGGAANFSQLRRSSRSEFFAWIGAHDRIGPDYLSEHLQLLGRYPAVVGSYSYFERIDTAGAVIGRDRVRGLAECWGGRWSRYFWSIVSGEVSAIHSLFRRSLMPDMDFDALPGCDHVFLSGASFNGRFVAVPRRHYQWRWFGDRGTTSSERVTGRVGAAADSSGLIAAFDREYEQLPATQRELTRYRRFAHWLVRDKFGPDSWKWFRKADSIMSRVRLVRRIPWLFAARARTFQDAAPQ